MSSLQMGEDIFNYTKIAQSSIGGRALLGLIATPTSINSFFTDLEPLFDPETLKRKIQKALDGVSQQLIRRYLLLPDDNRTTALGWVKYGELRLQVRPLDL